MAHVNHRKVCAWSIQTNIFKLKKPPTAVVKPKTTSKAQRISFTLSFCGDHMDKRMYITSAERRRITLQASGAWDHNRGKVHKQRTHKGRERSHLASQETGAAPGEEDHHSHWQASSRTPKPLLCRAATPNELLGMSSKQKVKLSRLNEFASLWAFSRSKWPPVRHLDGP